MEHAQKLVPHRYVAIGGHGPEDVVADSRGRVLTGVADGRILRLDGLADRAATRVEVLAETGGRPLGLELLTDDDLLVCDAELGLLRVDLTDGLVRILADSVAGERLRFCSNTVALSDGSICFTVSSRRYPLHQWIGDIVEHTATGRLLRLAPGSERPEVLAEGLQFANGLALSADESFLVVAETGACRLTRHWLTGPHAGRTEPFAENLPGMPDNLWRAGPDGPIWVSLAGPRVPPARPPAPRRPGRPALRRPPGGPRPVPPLRHHRRPRRRRTRRDRPPPHPPPLRLPHGHQRLRGGRPTGPGQPVGAGHRPVRAAQR